MSEVISVGTGSETIHGTQAGAIAYISMMFGDEADAWSALTSDEQKKTLAAAVRFLNRQNWAEDYDTFAERDAVAAFATAQYELAVMISDDPSVIQAADQGSNIASLSGGSASIEFFNPTTDGADPMPPILMSLLSGYLASAALGGEDGGESLSSCATNPFSACKDYEPGGPY